MKRKATAKLGIALVVPAWLTVAFIAFSPVRSTPARGQERDGAISTLIPSEDGEKIYQQQCQVCHGTKGKGDGPVAGALKPPPADFTNAQLMDSLTNEDLLEAISKGMGSMPGFAGVLKPEDVAAVIEYIRSLDDREE